MIPRRCRHLARRGNMIAHSPRRAKRCKSMRTIGSRARSKPHPADEYDRIGSGDFRVVAAVKV
jgi:hypothetical protein